MVTVKISAVGTGHCALTDRDGEGLTVAFETEPPQFLSWKGFKQLLTWKTPPAGKPVAKTDGEKKS